MCVFCGAASGADPAYAEAASELGATMAARGVRLVFGGGHVGLMGLVADAVLGAGGVARAIVAGFAEYGCDVFVLNRTADKARALADEVGAPAFPLADAAALEADVWINGTSVGMHPRTDASPLPQTPSCWNADTLVFDTIYNPVQTQLLERAQAAGCKTVSGVDMFVRQAAAQFQRWTGQPAPRQVMQRVVLDRLNTTSV